MLSCGDDGIDVFRGNVYKVAELAKRRLDSSGEQNLLLRLRGNCRMLQEIRKSRESFARSYIIIENRCQEAAVSDERTNPASG
jgi:hypothetical protein